jgi:hypothetical protein
MTIPGRGDALSIEHRCARGGRSFRLDHDYTLGDRSGMNIPIINVPAFVTVIGVSAAGKLGHAPIEARSRRGGKSPHGLGLERSRTTADRGSRRGYADVAQRGLSVR